MERKHRLVFIALCLILLVIVSRSVGVPFQTMLQQFWFAAGIFLVVLLSLIDQPFFSKDANIFVNGTTAWISLLLVPQPDRDWVWRVFFLWAVYLIVASYALMWIRQRKLSEEPSLVTLLSRVNRQIGRPEAIFSAFFLWGCAMQLGVSSRAFNALFIYWAIFMILNLPSVAAALSDYFAHTPLSSAVTHPTLHGIISPRIATLNVPASAASTVGKTVTIKQANYNVAKGVIVDDRTLAGRRIARVALTERTDHWTRIASDDDGVPHAELDAVLASAPAAAVPIGVVGNGSCIGELKLLVHPDAVLREGELLCTQLTSGQQAYYQIVSGEICPSDAGDNNTIQDVSVTAPQLGIWQDATSRFEPVTWVAPAGALVFRATATHAGVRIPDGHAKVGNVPNSDFPIHVNLNDIVTHNTAIIGVTGCGKSYLCFHLIDSIVALNIKVLILDVSRQHFAHMHAHTPHALKTPADVAAWIASNRPIGVHQYAISQSYPQTTSEFVQAAFDQLAKTQLQPGRNEPAKLCVILEEAHSLIPEWNQVAQQTDTNHVNRTARVILQGRKYGMGCIIVSQRTANVTKTILNQCNTIFALQSFDQTGLDFLKNYMGEGYARAISTMPIRHAILVGKASSSTRPVMFEAVDLSNRWNAPRQPEAATPTNPDEAQTPNDTAPADLHGRGGQ